MKKTLLFPLLLLSIACSQADKPMSDLEKEKIIGEARVVIDEIIKLCENPDPEGLIKLYLNSPDFVALVGGVQSDYATGCEGARNYLNNASPVMNMNFFISLKFCRTSCVSRRPSCRLISK